MHRACARRRPSGISIISGAAGTPPPFHHRDPFDRLIICQSMVEKMAICTCDENIKRYPVSLIW